MARTRSGARFFLLALHPLFSSSMKLVSSFRRRAALLDYLLSFSLPPLDGEGGNADFPSNLEFSRLLCYFRSCTGRISPPGNPLDVRVLLGVSLFPHDRRDFYATLCFLSFLTRVPFDAMTRVARSSCPEFSLVPFLELFVYSRRSCTMNAFSRP